MVEEIRDMNQWYLWKARGAFIWDTVISTGLI